MLPPDRDPAPAVPPAVAPPAAWAGTGEATPAAPAGGPSAADLAFGDTRLRALMAEAAERAPDLLSARTRLAEARARRALAQSALWPTLAVSTSGSRRRAPGASGASATTDLFDAGFDASWEIDLMGGLRAGSEGAAADVRAAEATAEDARTSLLAEVARLYIELRVDQARLASSRESVASLAGLADIARWSAEAGTGSDLDAQQAQAALAQARASQAALALALVQSRQALAVLVGRPPAGLDAMLADPAPLPALPDHVAVGVPADALRRRPDVRAAEATLQAELARTREARAAQGPSLTLAASLGWQATTLDALVNGPTALASMAASLAQPLLDGGRLRAQLGIQTAVQARAAVAYGQAVLAALGDVEGALAALRQARERVDRLGEAAVAAREAARLARIRHDAGLADFTTVLDTQRTLAGVEDALAVARGDALEAVVRLRKGLGGAWPVDTAAAATAPAPATATAEAESDAEAGAAADAIPAATAPRGTAALPPTDTP